MFGRKQELIDNLRADLTYVRECRDKYYSNWQKVADELARTKSELSILQEAFRNGVKVTDELHTKVFDLSTRNGSQDYELAEARLQAENLREEAAESSRMLELYKALVASLRIVIKLPARKK